MKTVEPPFDCTTIVAGPEGDAAENVAAVSEPGITVVGVDALGVGVHPRRTTKTATHPLALFIRNLRSS